MSENWYEILQKPADVDKTPPNDGDALIWDAAVGLWVPKPGGGGGNDEKVKIDNLDTTAERLDAKLVVGSGLTKTVLNVGGVEQLQIGLYSALTITSFTNTVGIVEKGLTVNNVNLAWGYNSPSVVISQSLTDVGAVTLGVYAWAFTGLGLTSNKTWTLSASDGTSNPTANTSVLFYSKRYWEPLANSGPVVDADIIAMSGQELSASRLCTKVFNCTGGRYIWFCYPAVLGLASFWVAGLEVTFNLSVQSFTNASGFTTNYNVYRSLYLQNGAALSVEVR